MEQRIGSSSQPLDGAGMDPAFIPGLTSPASAAEPEDPRSDEAEPEEKGTVGDAVADAGGEPSAEDENEETAGEEPEEEPEGEQAPEGPVFEAADRRARIVADHGGIRLRLDDQECEFGWDEIGAVETETARFGKRFTVTVHTPERRWYPLEIEADSRSRFTEWDARLDEVLDAYFEDGGKEPAAPGKDDD
ncbi:hypothetical protein ACFSL4_22735 [Streptomyces caeni]|uniref:DUF3027 domain-containing protein n=1 Tax=Streptomyces caeni TaxID=2307231 RepID=A0ABW4IWQ7_9ACTN